MFFEGIQMLFTYTPRSIHSKLSFRGIWSNPQPYHWCILKCQQHTESLDILSPLYKLKVSHSFLKQIHTFRPDTNTFLIHMKMMRHNPLDFTCMSHQST